MSTLQIDLDEELLALLRGRNQSESQAARELIALELYREGAISSGRAAAMLGMERRAFMQRASDAGVPHFDMTQEEWDAERQRSAEL